MSYETKIQRIREALIHVKNPLFLFDDDPDGLCSFLLFFRFTKSGKSVIVKSSPEVGEAFLPKVKEYEPDALFILDKPLVSEKFISQVHVPIYWIDHHQPQERNKVVYLNPIQDFPEKYIPTSQVCYDIVQQDLWIGVVGTVSDWAIPPFFPEFLKQYPSYAVESTDPGELLFHTQLGRLIRSFSMLLKGASREVHKNISLLARVSHPDEILFGTTKEGRFLRNRTGRIEQRYNELLADAQTKAGEDPMVIYTYSEDKWSFSGELSTELVSKFPEKIVLVCREKSGTMKCSIRSKTAPIRGAVQEALAGVEGYGGGHEKACGAVVNAHDFQRFVAQLRESIFKHTE